MHSDVYTIVQLMRSYVFTKAQLMRSDVCTKAQLMHSDVCTEAQLKHSDVCTCTPSYGHGWILITIMMLMTHVSVIVTFISVSVL
jgi:hypothetical protein